MITVSNIDKNTMRLAGKIQQLAELSGRETKTIVRNVGRDYARAALRATPIAPKFRTVVRVLDKAGNFVCWRKAGGQIPNAGRGFAKAGWLRSFEGLGINLTGVRTGGKAREYGDFEQRGSAYDAMVRLTNAVPYIVELDQGSSTNPPFNIHAKAMLAAENQINKALFRLEQKQRSAWI